MEQREEKERARLGLLMDGVYKSHVSRKLELGDLFMGVTDERGTRLAPQRTFWTSGISSED
ncbi:hypothetical protein CDL15_Pgr020173 [Punica granatum]|uniref:Uncharacterized protein n=1 Tax=Punica granatum TaxID=22663 RepID=A0A218VRE5_PUNGR|nr:hypothetical protein CDL15_Pgr020173 [Punica granatum]